MELNKNVLWSKVFVDTLSTLGVKYACTSPGSRNSPLLTALAENDKIKKYVHVDERAAAFFALGIAKAENAPVILTCTSGTATGEYYPAIMEAFRSRIPLIVITADRPKYLVDACANQTINQHDLYSDNVRMFYDCGLPEINQDGLLELKNAALIAFQTATKINRGPVHINMPFEKPLEAQFTNCEISEELYNEVYTSNKPIEIKPESDNLELVLDSIKSLHKGVIFAGPDNYSKELCDRILELSNHTGYPVVADINSNLRFTQNNQNVLTHYETYFQNKRFVEEVKAKVIIQFGHSMTCNKLEEYIKADEPFYFVINEYGDTNDPYRLSQNIKSNPIEFCDYIISGMPKRENATWINGFLGFEHEIEKVKKYFDESVIKHDIFESNLIERLIKLAPEGTNFFLSNSMPVRDFDLFSGKDVKQLNFYHNRGVSGIDGTLATALGVSEIRKNPTILITGDLSFIYDISSIILAKKYSIPLLVILINNNGGSIFNYLPIAEQKDYLQEFFTVPYDLDFSKVVKGMGSDYKLLESIKDLEVILTSLGNSKNEFLTVEVKIDAKKSFDYRKALKHRIHDVLEVLL